MEEAAAALASVLPTSEAHLHSLLCSQDKFFAAVRCRLIGLLPAEVVSAEMASPEPSHIAARAAAITTLVSLVHAHRILAQTDGGATASPATSEAALLVELPLDERSALLSCAAALGLSSPGSHETVGAVLARLRSAADTLADDGCSAADTATATHSGALLSLGAGGAEAEAVAALGALNDGLRSEYATRRQMLLERLHVNSSLQSDESLEGKDAVSYSD
ncbi:hypothetical protein EMIHUDRAFT_204846 [Emiliania huxleyi CCMP1516]|uniref:Uncharacterized protein n=2 Tax=Emiliania huxleyi TaxID=2903 RepID=A0A0D3JWG3_EMIH1|nr:hypothetical protein EMIHUDRAFT_204846 [Emiliania huxleyi CCMP1516]EOD27848.1 hypothetical protein EMIHUDRAFT_204846 [Emiliania huxleyi CCMP1516]|eukprot:XP_005780277.1 hypothetical protein EMIHUDRAFT_204846 [Emiliania huxleyi CCMP1516]